MNKFLQIFLKKTLKFLLSVLAIILIFEYALKERQAQKRITYRLTYENRIELSNRPLKYVFENISDEEKTSQFKQIFIDDIDYFIHNRLASPDQLMSRKSEKENESKNDKLCPYVPPSLCKCNFNILLKK
jgi:hypothetical protein